MPSSPFLLLLFAFLSLCGEEGASYTYGGDWDTMDGPHWSGAWPVSTDWASATTQKVVNEIATAGTTAVTLYCDAGVVNVTAPRCWTRSAQNDQSPNTWATSGGTIYEYAMGEQNRLFTASTSQNGSTMWGAVAGDGNENWIAAVTLGNSQMRVYTSHDDGETFTTSPTYTASANLTSHQRIRAMYVVDRFYVVWSCGTTDLDVAYITSTDGGDTWSTLAWANSNADVDASDDHVLGLYVSSSDLTLHVLTAMYQTSDWSLFLLNKPLASPTFSPVSIGAPLLASMSDNGIDERYAAVAANGKYVAVIYCREAAVPTISLATSSDYGATFQGPYTLYDNDTATEMDIVTDGTNTWVAAWASISRGSLRHFFDVDSNVTRSITSPSDILYSVSTGSTQENLIVMDGGFPTAGSPLTGWSLPKPLDGIAFLRGYTGSTYRPRLAVDGNGYWVATFLSSKAKYSSEGWNLDFSTITNNQGGVVSDAVFSSWIHKNFEFCVMRSLLIPATCPRAVQDRVDAALPNVRTSIAILGDDFGFFGDYPDISTASIFIEGSKWIAITSQYYVEVSRWDCEAPIFTILDSTSRLEISGDFVWDTGFLVYNTGNSSQISIAPTNLSNPDTSVINTCYDYLLFPVSDQQIRCPLGFRPPAGTEDSALCVPCPAGRTCDWDFNATTVATTKSQLCPVGALCPPGTFFPALCNVFRYYNASSQPMMALSDCSNAGTPCKPGYYCPPGANDTIHLPLITVTPEAVSETIVFPGDFVQLLNFSVGPGVIPGHEVQLLDDFNEDVPGWLDWFCMSGCAGLSDTDPTGIWSSTMDSDTPGYNLSDVYTYSVSIYLWDYSNPLWDHNPFHDDDVPTQGLPLIIPFTRSVTSVLLNPTDEVRVVKATSDGNVTLTSVFIFNVACSDTLSWSAHLWDCDGRTDTLAVTDPTLYPIDYAGFASATQGVITPGVTEPATVALSVDPYNSIRSGLIQSRLPNDSTPPLEYLGGVGTITLTACLRLNLTLSSFPPGVSIYKDLPVYLQLFEDCPPGKSSTDGTSKDGGCTPCASGTQQPNFRGLGCDPCPNGFYAESTNTKTCLACPAGHFSTRKSASTSCSPCEAGTYLDNVTLACQPCDRGQFSNARNATQCSLCLPGSYQAGTGQSSCIPCALGSYQNVSGESSCIACPESHPRTLAVGSLSLDDCLTAPGYFEDLDKKPLLCDELGPGVTCLTEGVTLETIELKPGYWRSNNRSKSIMQCYHPQFCVGGVGNNRTSSPSSSSASAGGNRRELSTAFGDANYCLPHHIGAMCEGCEPGYVRRGSNPCAICDAAALANDNLRLSWTIAAACFVVVFAFFLIQRQRIWNATKAVVRRASVVLPTHPRPAPVSPRAAVASGDAPTTVAPDDSHNAEGVVIPLHTPSGPSRRAPPFSPGERAAASVPGETRESFSGRNYSRESASREEDEFPAARPGGRFFAETGRGAGNMGSKRLSKRNLKNITTGMSQRLRPISVRLDRNATLLWSAVATIEANITLRILVSLFQVIGGMSSTFYTLFPTVFHDIATAFNVVSASVFYNIDFACVVHSNHYLSLILAMIAPLAGTVIIAVTHFAMERRFRLEGRMDEVQKLRNGSFSLFLLLLFLIYPNISATILKTFDCSTFDDGSSYLRADLTVSCQAPDRTQWVVLATVGVLVYVVGVPAVYLGCLWQVRQYINPPHGGKPDPSKYPHLLFLTEIYKRDSWWFEVFELLRKLLQTSLIVFLLDGSVMQTVAMVVVAMIIVNFLNERRPYISTGANRLAIVAQWEILIISFLGLLYKVDIVTLDRSWSYDKRSLLDGFLIAAAFMAPVFALVQQHRRIRRGLRWLMGKIRASKCSVRVLGVPPRRSSLVSHSTRGGAGGGGWWGWGNMFASSRAATSSRDDGMMDDEEKGGGSRDGGSRGGSRTRNKNEGVKRVVFSPATSTSTAVAVVTTPAESSDSDVATSTPTPRPDEASVTVEVPASPVFLREDRAATVAMTSSESFRVAGGGGDDSKS